MIVCLLLQLKMKDEEGQVENCTSVLEGFILFRSFCCFAEIAFDINHGGIQSVMSHDLRQAL